ncbi:MAG TPA: hypothetical protein PL163_11225, partial [Leptospiraceae bacterium]|nr:hypothetical protein [Leptospiraceae bacterium]
MRLFAGLLEHSIQTDFYIIPELRLTVFSDMLSITFLVQRVHRLLCTKKIQVHCSLQFDFYIISTQEGYDQNQERFKKCGAAAKVLLFSIDVRQEWRLQPYSKQELGLPENSFVMTTISNHLDTRLSTAMCRAVGEILQRCPEAVY